jgi:hypothetical protein
MTTKEYQESKSFVIHVHDIARKYESDFLRGVADRMDESIEDRKLDQRLKQKQLTELNWDGD